MNEKRLGRGLDYLLNLKKEDISDTTKVQSIPIKDIRQNRFQPRENIEKESLNELMYSIQENGVLQPILVRKDGIKYEIIAGERRFKACLALGKDTIPAIMLDVPENKLLQLALIENIQREDLSPIEEAKAYQTMLRLEKISHEELSKRVGKKRSTITNFIRLLDLPFEVQEYVSRGTISQGHARALLGLEDRNQILKVCGKIIAEDLSVRSVEKLLKNINKKAKTNKVSNKASKDPNILSYEDTLKNNLKTKVEINLRGKKGKIEIHFYSLDDFDRLYNILNNFNIN